MITRFKREALEQEYQAPLEDTVRGFFRDGESLASLAQILEVSETSLLDFCRSAGIRFRLDLDRQRWPIDRRGRSDRFREVCGCPLVDGRRMSFSELAERAGITARCIHYRLQRGIPLPKAGTNPAGL